MEMHFISVRTIVAASSGGKYEKNSLKSGNRALPTVSWVTPAPKFPCAHKSNPWRE